MSRFSSSVPTIPIRAGGLWTSKTRSPARIPVIAAALVLLLAAGCVTGSRQVASVGPAAGSEPSPARDVPSRLALLGYEATVAEFERGVQDGNAEAVDLFLAAGFDPDGEVDPELMLFGEGYPLLYHAAVGGHAGIARSLVNAGADGAIGLTSVLSEFEDADAVRLLLEAGVDANSRGEIEYVEGRLLERFLFEYYTDYLFSGAIPAGTTMLEVVRLFVENDLEINSVNGEGETIFHTISSMWTEATPDILRVLLDAGGDIDLAGDEAAPPVLEAASDPAALETLLTLGADPNLQDDRGRNAALIAAEAGSLENVKVLIEAGADLSTPDETGNTALRHALLQANTEMAQALLDARAETPGDTTMHTFFGLFLDVARGDNTFLTVENLSSDAVTREALDTALLVAVRAENLVALAALLESRADPNTSDEAGEPIIFEAVASDNIEAVGALLSAGASLDARNVEDETVLDIAADNGSPAVMSILLENGLDPNAAAGDGQTLLMRTASAGSLGFGLLLGSEAALDRRIYWEERQDSFSDHAVVARLLIGAGADVNAVDQGGDTALIDAVVVGNGPVVRLLIEAGADLDHRNQVDKTALMQAREQGEGFQFLVDMLVEAGAGG